MTAQQQARDSAGLWGAYGSIGAEATLIPTIAPVPPAAVVPQSTGKGSVSGGSSYSGGDMDCPDFSLHAEAQAYFEGRGGSPSNNVDRLDTDHDGLACESLP